MALTLAACSNDASLKVTVQHDPDYTSLIDHTEVSIYASPGLACDQIEFGDITDDQLLGALVAKADDGGSLDNIPRVDSKIIVARGFAADGSLVTAGCTPQGEVTGNAAVTVTTVAAATVSIGLANDGSAGVIVTTTDARNDSIDGRAVNWKLYGAAGTSADASMYMNLSDGVWAPTHPTCTVDGDASIHPALPKLPGGYGLRLRVSWAAKPVPLFTSFTPVDVAVTSVSSPSDQKIIKSCALRGIPGSASIVCMISTTQFIDYGYAATTNTLVPSAANNLPTLVADDWIGVVSVPSPGGGLFAYAVSTKGAWAALEDAPPAAVGATWCQTATSPLRCTAGVFAIDDMRVVPPCGGSPGFLIAHGNEGTKLRTEPLGGGNGTEYVVKDAGLVNAGCVSELQADSSSKSRQAVVLTVPAMGTTQSFMAAVFDCSSTKSPCSVPLPTGGQTVAFSTGSEQRLIGTTFDATGAQLSQWVMQPAIKHGVIGVKDRLVERSRQVAASPPRVLVTGSFDNDSDPDLLWTFSTRQDIDVQIAYARTAEGAPLSALTSVDSPGGAVQPTDMFTMDFNNDGYDEIAIVATTSLLTQTFTSLVVVRTGIPYTMQIGSTQDASCP